MNVFVKRVSLFIAVMLLLSTFTACSAPNESLDGEGTAEGNTPKENITLVWQAGILLVSISLLLMPIRKCVLMLLSNTNRLPIT